MRTIEHTVTIEAPVRTVWQILTDTKQYEVWNPFITRFEGSITQGSQLTVTVRPGARKMTFRPTVLAVEELRLIEWRGRLGMRGIFDGDHELRLEELDNGTTSFTQRETFTGILVPFLGSVLADTAEGFAAMNAALRDRAVHLAQAS